MAGQRGPLEKRKGRQRRKSTSKVVDLRPRSGVALDVPPADRGWLTETKNDWATYWQSDMATLVRPEAVPALKRLFDLRDERERARIARDEGDRLVEGSQGQMVLNPLIKYIVELDKEIRALEDRFGGSPMALLRTGVNLGAAAKSLEDMNRAFDAEEDIDDEEADPRQAGKRKAIDI